MRKLVLSIAAITVFATTPAQAGDDGKLTVGEARSAARAYLKVQVEALAPLEDLSVSSARISGRPDRVGRHTMIVPVAFALNWDRGPSFVCRNRVWVTERGASVRARPGHLDCY